MSLRSRTADENGPFPLRMALSSVIPAAGGNPGLLLGRISLDTRPSALLRTCFRGYDEPNCTFQPERGMRVLAKAGEFVLPVHLPIAAIRNHLGNHG